MGTSERVSAILKGGQVFLIGSCLFRPHSEGVKDTFDRIASPEGGYIPPIYMRQLTQTETVDTEQFFSHSI